MSSTEVPSTQESMNSLDRDIWGLLEKQWKKVKDGILHRDTNLILGIVIIVLFIYIYLTRATASNPLERLRLLSGLIFLFILIYSFGSVMDQLKVNIDTFCLEQDKRAFGIDINNRFYAGFSFIYYFLNLYAKVIINTIILFTILYILYILCFLQAEGPMYRRSLWQFSWKTGRDTRISILKCVFLLPLCIRFAESITQWFVGGIKVYQHVDGTPRYNYKQGIMLNIKEFKEFISPEHLFYFANILIPTNLTVHKFVFLLGLLFSTIYGIVFINPINKENLCNNQNSPESKKLLTSISTQFRLGLLVLITLLVIFYLVFIAKLTLDSL